METATLGIAVLGAGRERGPRLGLLKGCGAGTVGRRGRVTAGINHIIKGHSSTRMVQFGGRRRAVEGQASQRALRGHFRRRLMAIGVAGERG